MKIFVVLGINRLLSSVSVLGAATTQAQGSFILARHSDTTDDAKIIETILEDEDYHDNT